ncbi:hypothetical protein [Pleurocapsa sp. CCALA 161]|uniref:hypothetical protein n=1 Tax=Pleurocapsa sp. CCALA 161 TaxID=2107688 RepID=UPI0011B23D33|nr:hypothetical protein [Pleurocapsa sp. CCALA 161]
MSINNSQFSDRNWNSKKLIQLSDNLSQAYNPGLNNAKSDCKTDSWTTDKFIAMSRHLSSAYGVDFN